MSKVEKSVFTIRTTKNNNMTDRRIWWTFYLIWLATGGVLALDPLSDEEQPYGIVVGRLEDDLIERSVDDKTFLHHFLNKYKGDGGGNSNGNGGSNTTPATTTTTTTTTTRAPTTTTAAPATTQPTKSPLEVIIDLIPLINTIIGMFPAVRGGGYPYRNGPYPVAVPPYGSAPPAYSYYPGSYLGQIPPSFPPAINRISSVPQLPPYRKYSQYASGYPYTSPYAQYTGSSAIGYNPYRYIKK